MSGLQWGVLCSAIRLFCLATRVHAIPGDALVFLQQQLRHPPELTGQGSCRELPRPLHYNYGQFHGSYGGKKVDWSDDDFQHAAKLGRRGAYGQLAPLMQKLYRGGTLKIAVFGGSATAGSNCEQNGVTAKECSWPRRFQHWLQTAFPRAAVELTNFAQGGATSSSILAGLGIMLQAAHRPDLIFLDTLVNDVYQFQKGAASWHHLMRDRGTNCAMAFEQLLRSLHELEPQAVIFPVLAGCEPCLEHRSAQLDVMEHYDLPRLDWNDFTAWKSHLWDGPDYHPYFWAHQSIADVLAMLWGSVWKEQCSSHSAKQKGLDWRTTHFEPRHLREFQPCLKPLSAYDASIPEFTKHVKLGKGWSLFEDRPGKPGWISETQDSHIKFPLRFGKHPALVVTWMRSYQKLGYATLELNEHEERLDGLWTDGASLNASLAHTRWFQADFAWAQQKNPEVALTGFNIMPHTNHTLKITIPTDPNLQYHKMKIMQVFSC